MGLKIIIFCALVFIANGSVIENIKRTSLAAKSTDEVVHHSSTEDSPAADESIAMKIPTSLNFSMDGDSMKPVEEDDDHDEVQKTRKTRGADYFEDASGFSSPRAVRRTIIERLNKPSRLVRVTRQVDDPSERQSPATYSKDVDRTAMKDSKDESKTKNDANVEENHSTLLADTANRELNGEDRIERLNHSQRSARQAPNCNRFTVNLPLCCSTRTTNKTPPSRPAPTYPLVCPTSCPQTCPPTCITTTKPSSCCILPTTCQSSSSYSNNNPGSSGAKYSTSQYPVQCIIRSAPQPQPKCCITPQKKASCCRTVARAPTTAPCATAFMKYSGNGNNVCAGSTCSGRCSNQNACMIQNCGNCGENNVTSCMNVVSGGSLLKNCGSRACSRVSSKMNVVVGNCGCLTDGTVQLVKSLYQLCCGDDCCQSDSNCRCNDYDSSEEYDPCCYCLPTTAVQQPPSDPCSDQPITYSCCPLPCQPSTPTSNVPGCIILPARSSCCCSNMKK